MASTKGQGYIIYESATNVTPAMLAESEKNISFKAELQEAEVPNRNGRIYSKDALDQAINHYSVAEKLATKSFYGRLCPSL